MRVSEILRKMADVVDQVEGGVQTVQQPEVAPIVQQPEVQVTAIPGQIEEPTGDAQCDAPAMVSPLQQEHELLKKSQGVDNNVSEFAGDAEFDDELAAMKQSAGIGEEQANAAAHEEDRRLEGQLNPRKNAALAFHKAKSDRA